MIGGDCMKKLLATALLSVTAVTLLLGPSSVSSSYCIDPVLCNNTPPVVCIGNICIFTS